MTIQDIYLNKIEKFIHNDKLYMLEGRSGIGYDGTVYYSARCGKESPIFFPSRLVVTPVYTKIDLKMTQLSYLQVGDKFVHNNSIYTVRETGNTYVVIGTDGNDYKYSRGCLVITLCQK